MSFLFSKSMVASCLVCAVALPHVAMADIVINDESQLREFAAAVNDGSRDYVGENVCLANDIVLAGDGAWTPIGTSEHPFRGHFEGWGHTISNLTISGTNYAGFFGYVDGGSIRDVGVVTGNISGGHYAGAICGYVANSGEISSCYATINVSGSQYVGGICGFFNGSEIKDCHSTGNVTSNGSFIGGIVGQVYNGDVRRCYFTGQIDYYSIYGYYGSIVGDVKNGQEGIDIEYCVYKKNDENVPKAIGCNMDGDEIPTDGANRGATAEEMQTATFWSGKLNTESYNTAWAIADGSYPQLNSFVKNQPVTFAFTAAKQWLTIVPNGNYTVPASMKAYIVTGVDVASGIVSLRSVSTLNEGRGALVWSEGGESIIAYPTQGALSDYSDDQWLKGSHVSPVILKGDKTEYVLSGGMFHRSQSGVLARNKAYLKVAASGSSSNSLKVIIEEDDATAVRNLNNNANHDPSIYDLSGRKVSGQPAKGQIYIKNGKKIIIR